MPRILKRNNVDPISNNNTNVIMVTTYGSDNPLQDMVDNLPNKEKLPIRKVSKTALSLKQKFALALPKVLQKNATEIVVFVAI